MDIYPEVSILYVKLKFIHIYLSRFLGFVCKKMSNVELGVSRNCLFFIFNYCYLVDLRFVLIYIRFWGL